MKIVSRKAAPAYEPTPGVVTNVRVDCDTNYISVYSNGYPHKISQREFYMEVTIRVPLSDDDIADGLKLNQRINKIHKAQLLEDK